MKLMKLAGAAAVGALALTTGLAGTASADIADDIPILLGNLPATVEEVVEGVQAAVDTYTDTQSFVAANDALQPELVDAINDLVNGTTQFGALGGFGASLLVSTINGVPEPILAALDDPSLAGEIIDGDDIAQLLENVPVAVQEALWPQGLNWGLGCAAADALRGNLTDGLFATTSVSGCGIFGAYSAYIALRSLDNDAIQATNGAMFVLIIALPSLIDPHLLTLEDALAPVFDALAPVTGPVADAIDDLAP